MKLTDEQIKQALEFCANCECNSEKTEKECALITMSFCKNYLRKQSLDYINRLEAENRRLQAKIKEFDEKLVIQKGLIYRQTARIEALQMDNNQLQSDIINANQNYVHIKEFVEKVVFEIVNKPSEFTAKQGTADFLSGSAHRQNEIIDIIEKMAVNCDE